MKGKNCYIYAGYINGERARASLLAYQAHPLDRHFGPHVVIGQYDGCVVVAPLRGQETTLKLPEHAVWIQ